MRLLLRRSLSTAASASGRAFSTAASRPPWAMIHNIGELVRSPALRASFQLAEPPCASHLRIPENLVDPRPRPDPNGDTMPHIWGRVRDASGDGLLLLDFMDARATAPIVGKHGDDWACEFACIDGNPDMTRFICNPLSGQLFRLPDIDGIKKTVGYRHLGILTQSERPNGPPDKYAVSWLLKVEGDFVTRRFLTQTGEWDKAMGLPSSLPRARRIDIDHEVVAFAGRLWWVDVSWGAISLDPFSDRPELRFVALPRGSVVEPVKGKWPLDLCRYRRLGVSEGRMRYAEPFVLSSFALEDDDSCWTLEHRVALNRLGSWADGCHPGQEKDTPCIGVIDPLNANIMILTVGNHAISVDMDRGKVIGCSLIQGAAGPISPSFGFLTPCALPPWLGSSLIPSAGDRLSYVFFELHV
ncbi:hypothetical protein C2845_PM05G35090 [Panicum miliaceum]|uniref:DUF1618 domain-containing protein n=1 Tax=Panicum miliaceum TaxID=4540 RepID=A0A3L6T0U4_PANMI|nr:hypothetical protein C2845_PM05G35090 [Panicum miliaceum]